MKTTNEQIKEILDTIRDLHFMHYNANYLDYIRQIKKIVLTESQRKQVS